MNVICPSFESWRQTACYYHFTWERFTCSSVRLVVTVPYHMHPTRGVIMSLSKLIPPPTLVSGRIHGCLQSQQTASLRRGPRPNRNASHTTFQEGAHLKAAPQQSEAHVCDWRRSDEGTVPCSRSCAWPGTFVLLLQQLVIHTSNNRVKVSEHLETEIPRLAKIMFTGRSNTNNGRVQTWRCVSKGRDAHMEKYIPTRCSHPTTVKMKGENSKSQNWKYLRIE